LIEIISQKYIEFFSCFVALFGEYKCGLASFQVTYVADHVALPQPLPIGEAAVAVIYSLGVHSSHLQRLVEAALNIEGVA
jgi:hypothetical protein